MIQVGDKMRKKVGFVDLDGHMAALVPVSCDCEVVYIHPQRRFYTLRVLLPSGKSFRTTEYFYPRAGGQI